MNHNQRQELNQKFYVYIRRAQNLSFICFFLFCIAFLVLSLIEEFEFATAYSQETYDSIASDYFFLLILAILSFYAFILLIITRFVYWLYSSKKCEKKALEV